ALVAVSAHLEHKGVPLSMPLDIVEVPKSHTGKELAAEFEKILEDFKITEKVSQIVGNVCTTRLTATKVLAVTCDNASNNTVMIEELHETLPDFGGTASHTRCFLHTVNLVAKSLL
ncbi:hypothetical protein P692DRAFT_20714526, partial [Suillus brevipes Sb2]